MLITMREKIFPVHCHKLEMNLGSKGALKTPYFSMDANHPEAMSLIIVCCLQNSGVDTSKSRTFKP